MSRLLSLNTIPYPQDVLNVFATYFSSLGKTFVKELRHIATSEKCFIKDSKSFVANIKDENMSDDEQFVSLDIKDMYPSLPKYDVLSEIKNRINDKNWLYISIGLAIYIIIRIYVIYY